MAIATATSPAATPTASPRTYAMCPPRFFGVTYAINPWMDPLAASSTEVAMRQWQELRAAYERAGHVIELIEPVPGQPDMVFAANAGLVIDRRALTSRFRYRERQGEERGFLEWFESIGLRAVRQARHVNEGEGDFVVVGDVLLAGFGFRTERAAHIEAERYFDMPVVSLE